MRFPMTACTVVGVAVLSVASLTGARSYHSDTFQTPNISQSEYHAQSSLRTVLETRFPNNDVILREAHALYQLHDLQTNVPDPLLRAALISLLGTEGDFILDAVRKGAIQILIFEKLIDQEEHEPLSQCGPPIDFGGVNLLDRDAVFDLNRVVDGKVDGAIHSGYVNEDIRFLAPIVFGCVYDALTWDDPLSSHAAYYYEAALARRIFNEFPELEQSEKWIARYYRNRRKFGTE